MFIEIIEWELLSVDPSDTTARHERVAGRPARLQSSLKGLAFVRLSSATCTMTAVTITTMTRDMERKEIKVDFVTFGAFCVAQLHVA